MDATLTCYLLLKQAVIADLNMRNLVRQPLIALYLYYRNMYGCQPWQGGDSQ